MQRDKIYDESIFTSNYNFVVGWEALNYFDYIHSLIDIFFSQIDKLDCFQTTDDMNLRYLIFVLSPLVDYLGY